MLLFVKYCVIIFSSFTICSVLAKPNHSQSFFTDNRLAVIENYIQNSMAENKVPGVAVALIEGGGVVYQKGFGVADGNGNLVTSQTPFQLASVTKTFTALLVVQLEADGKLLLSDYIIKHIPWFRTTDKSLSDQITIRHLLQHNSGLTTRSGNWTQNTTYRGQDATELSVKKLLDTRLHSPPGEVFQYSNSNFHILSHLIEVVEGKPFEEVMYERILAPMKMHDSFVQITDRKTPVPAVGFPHWFGHPIERSFILGRMKMGDGGMVASVEDMGQYVIEMATGGLGVVSKEMRDNLLNAEQNSINGYALGWELKAFKNGLLYQHDGANGGFGSMLGFSDAAGFENGIGFVILSNASSALYDQFVWGLREVILGAEPLPNRINKVNLVFLIAMYLSIFLLLYAIYSRKKKRQSLSFKFTHLIWPSMLLSFSYFMGYIIPAMFKINLLSIYPFFPDLAVGLIGCALLSLLLALLMIWEVLRSMKL